MNFSTEIIARTYGERTAATLNDLISMVVRPAKIILDGGEWTIDENVTLPASIAIEIMPDTVLNVSNGVTLTVEAVSFIVHSENWKTGAGTVSGLQTGRYIGKADTAVEAESVLAGALGTGMELSGGLINPKQATDTLVGGVALATATELARMTNALKAVTPALLSKYLHINYAFILDNTHETLTFANSIGTERIQVPSDRLTVSITPKFSNSKILIFGMLNGDSANIDWPLRVFLNRKVGGDAAVEIGNGTSWATPCHTVINALTANGRIGSATCLLVDNPGTVSEVKYYPTFGRNTAGTAYLNRSSAMVNNDDYASVTSTFLVIELPQQDITT